MRAKSHAKVKREARNLWAFLGPSGVVTVPAAADSGVSAMAGPVTAPSQRRACPENYQGKETTMSFNHLAARPGPLPHSCATSHDRRS
jgi:hypothetical protein